MRIAYFNANMRVGQDGVTRVMYKMMASARDRGHSVLALTSTPPDPGQTNIPMFKVPSVVLPLQKNYRIALPGYQRFARELWSFKPDLLHVNSPCTLGFGAMKYAHHFGVPIVATYHTHFPTYPRYYKIYGAEELIWKISRYLYNGMDRTFVPTLPILKELTEHGISRTEYLPNGVDTTLFSPEHRSSQWRETIDPTGKKSIILFVSRLVWEKDLRDLAATYELLRARRNDLEMVVVGDGYARKGFESLMPGAHFLGYQTGGPLAESYASSDIFAFPSTTETFGLVTVEAMSSGLIPVAAGYGGATGIIENAQSGFLTRPHDPVHMAEKIEWILNNPGESALMRKGALARSKQFGWEPILKNLFRQYEEILHSGNRSRRTAA